jgi:16S rRNA (uracil1498-N3)-methyltransferase
MHRFYVNGNPVLEDGDFHHAINVLRLQVGEEIELVQGLGLRFLARISQINAKSKTASLEIVEKLETSNEPNCKVHLIMGIPRLDKLTDIVDFCTQLGVHSITLAECRRTQGSYPRERWDKKIESLKKTAKGSAELASRDIVPEIAGPFQLERAILKSVGKKLIAWELEKTNTIPKSITINDNEITIIIGPEGGLEHIEVDCATKNGFIPVTLGKSILRAQLAPVVAISQIFAVTEENV